MSAILVDKIISYIVANNVPYKIDEERYVFSFAKKSKTINVYYYSKLKKFYIKASDNDDKPHVIKHWNPSPNNREMHGLCLTMDGKDYRDNKLDAKSSFRRVKEIIFENWKDPIGERFREINVMLQTSLNWNFIINKNGQLIDLNTHKEVLNVKYLEINYKGQNRKDIYEIINKHIKFYSLILLSIKYKNELKKVLIDSFNKDKFYKVNDLTPSSFFSRSGKFNNPKKVILVGCGSIGGLVLDFLCRLGFDNIDIYDDDLFEFSNNCRHILGANINDLEKTKVDALRDHYKNYFPNTKIESHSQSFDYSSKIDEECIIFNTTGGSHSEIEKKIKTIFQINSSSKIKVINIFIEPFAMAAHSITFSSSNANQINLAFHESRRYVVTRKKDFRKNFDGCFTPTLPYSFAPLQVGIISIMTKLLKNNFKPSHLTIPLVSMVEKKGILNEKLSKDLNIYKINVKEWKELK